MQRIALILSATLAVTAITQSKVHAQELLTNKSVVTLAEAGFNEDFIIDLIATGKTQFDTTVSGLAALAKQGISERLVRVMLNPTTPKTSNAQSVEAVPAATATDSKAKPTPLLLEPQRTALSVINHTPYYSRSTLLWGLWKRTLTVGVAPKTQDASPTRRDSGYQPVLGPGVFPVVLR